MRPAGWSITTSIFGTAGRRSTHRTTVSGRAAARGFPPTYGALSLHGRREFLRNTAYPLMKGASQFFVMPWSKTPGLAPVQRPQ